MFIMFGKKTENFYNEKKIRTKMTYNHKKWGIINQLHRNENKWKYLTNKWIK